MLLKDVTVLDSEPRLGQEHCFNLYDGKKAVLVAAATHAEKLCWMEDIAEAAQVKRAFQLFCSDKVLKLIILKMLPQCRVFLKICPFLPHFSRQN